MLLTPSNQRRMRRRVYNNTIKREMMTIMQIKVTTRTLLLAMSILRILSN
jgi:hypothetical protein